MELVTLQTNQQPFPKPPFCFFRLSVFLRGKKGSSSKQFYLILIPGPTSVLQLLEATFYF